MHGSMYLCIIICPKFCFDTKSQTTSLSIICASVNYLRHAVCMGNHSGRPYSHNCFAAALQTLSSQGGRTQGAAVHSVNSYPMQMLSSASANHMYNCTSGLGLPVTCVCGTNTVLPPSWVAPTLNLMCSSLMAVKVRGLRPPILTPIVKADWQPHQRQSQNQHSAWRFTLPAL